MSRANNNRYNENFLGLAQAGYNQCMEMPSKFLLFSTQDVGKKNRLRLKFFLHSFHHINYGYQNHTGWMLHLDSNNVIRSMAVVICVTCGKQVGE